MMQFDWLQHNFRTATEMSHSINEQSDVEKHAIAPILEEVADDPLLWSVRPVVSSVPGPERRVSRRIQVPMLHDPARDQGEGQEQTDFKTIKPASRPSNHAAA